jgi:hypothetical protein
MVKRAVRFLLFVLILGQASLAIDPEINGVFRIHTPANANGSRGQGTCFAIEQDGETVYLGTAFHVVESSDGRIYTGTAYTIENDVIKDIKNASVVATDAKADLAILKTTASRRFEILPLAAVESMQDVDKIGFSYRNSGKEVYCFGYASGFWLKTFGNLAFAYEQKVYSDGVVVPGQSGGPAVLDGKLVGVVSGGNNWFKAVEDTEKSVTWPTRLGSAKRLKEMLDWAKTQ